MTRMAGTAPTATSRSFHAFETFAPTSSAEATATAATPCKVAISVDRNDSATSAPVSDSMLKLIPYLEDRTADSLAISRDKAGRLAPPPGLTAIVTAGFPSTRESASGLRSRSVNRQNAPSGTGFPEAEATNA